MIMLCKILIMNNNYCEVVKFRVNFEGFFFLNVDFRFLM